MSTPKRDSKGEFIFADYPRFKPNLSPKEIFHLGSFGGTYWRPIKSSITGKSYKNIHIPQNIVITLWSCMPPLFNRTFYMFLRELFLRISILFSYMSHHYILSSITF